MLIGKIQNRLKRYLGVEVLKINPRDSIKFAKKYFGNKRIKVTEVGVFEGEHSLQILKNLNVERIYLVDPWTNYEEKYGQEIFSNGKKFFRKNEMQKIFEKCRKKLKKYHQRCTYIRKYSDEALKDLPDDLDYIYIDGNHNYDFVKKDIENYFSKLKKGGMLAGHDIQLFAVSKALTEFCSKNKIAPHISKRMDWWILKEN